MKIKYFEVHGLFGQEHIPILKFHDDLNILSGRNGAGKTTLLKLMWYLISGNFDKAVAEIKFTSAKLVTDEYELDVSIDLDNQENPLTSEIKFFTTKGIKVDEKFLEFNEQNHDQKIDWFLAQYLGSSYLFPTFRIIEGGFATEKYDIKHDVLKEFYLKINNNEGGIKEIEEALKKLSNILTNKSHNFVTSISATNIDSLLVKKYASVLKSVSNIQNSELQKYNEQMSLFNQYKDADRKDKIAIDSKLQQLDLERIEIANKKNEVYKPLSNIENAVKTFFRNKTIQFGGKIKFCPNDSPDYIPQMEDNRDEVVVEDNVLFTNNLSAGEKQLLTFVTYNSFYDNTIFFIDEPELSLHVDWQRILFRILKQQNPTNQFIISTHSPFIYAKYEDKEICIDPQQDRGFVEG